MTARRQEDDCVRCGRVGILEGGLCVVCELDSTTFTEPATCHAGAEFEKTCTFCGRATDRIGEACRTCDDEIIGRR